MTLKSYFQNRKSSVVLPVATIALAAAIFAADSLTDLEIAAPVLYVAVVLMSVRFCARRGVVLVAAGCMALTIFAYFLTPVGVKQAGSINTALARSSSRRASAAAPRPCSADAR